MIKRKIKADIGEKLKNLCESLSERERKKVLIGMLVISAILCGITVTRAFGRFLSHGSQRELPFGKDALADPLYKTDKDSVMFHPKTHE